MKALFKGYISFGLVNFNIELYSAIESQAIGFKLLHAKCKTPISYKRWCGSCNEEVDWENIVKGYPLKDGTYFIITKENLEKLKPEKSEYINILEFVDKDAIQPIYYDHHYYVLEGDSLNKAYFLFMQTLKELNKAAIGKFILREKEHVCSIQPYQDALLLSTLNYSYEIRNLGLAESRKKSIKLDKQELQLAEELINRLYTKEFSMSKYKDTFHQELAKRIEAAATGVKIEKPKVVAKAPQAPSLIEALKQSISEMPQVQDGIEESVRRQR